MNNTIDHLTPEMMEQQEHLSLQQLKSLKADCEFNVNEKVRPTANFIELMNWVSIEFGGKFLDVNNVNLNKFVHNRVIIDGQFLHFCQEKKVEVKCVFKDFMISWKSDNNFEKYFAQGVFLIKNKETRFLHAALFHKGNQNEDEISFFIIVSDENFEGYLKLRNEFDEWVQERDRSNLHIRVIEGEDLPYTKDSG